jgi:hypothetical protein
MSRNGSGTYTLPAGNPVVTGTTITSNWANTTLTDISTALTGSVAADGQTPITGDLQMGGNKITGLGTPTSNTDAATKAYVDSGVAGLGTMATQNANAVSITGGTIAGCTINSTSIGATTTSTGAFTTLKSSSTTSLGGTAASVRAINFTNEELAWIPSSGLNAFLNVCDSSGNNGTNYSFNIRGLGSSGGAGVTLSTFGVNATTSTFYGNVVANSYKGTNAASAWVYFYGGAGTTSGQVIKSSNVSSVTVVGTGNWTINFTTALADTNYVAFGSNDGLGGGRNYVTTFGANLAGGQYSTTACSCAVVSSGGGATDTGFVRAVFFD